MKKTFFFHFFIFFFVFSLTNFSFFDAPGFGFLHSVHFGASSSFAAALRAIRATT